MKSKNLVLFFLMCLFVFRGYGFSIGIISNVEPDTVHFAEVFEVVVEIQAPKDSLIVVRDIPRSEYFAFLDTLWQVEKKDDFVKTTIRFKFVPFVEGELRMFGFRIQIGRTIYNLDTAKVFVLPIEKDSVKLAQIDTSQLLRIFDVKEPINTPLTFKELWLRYRYWLLGLLIALLIGYLIYRLIKKLRERKSIVKEKLLESIDPWAWTMEQLDKLENQKLCIKSDFEHFYYKLSEILRWYLEKNYNFSALEMTTSELKVFLSNTSFIDSDLVNELINLLSKADLVKYAKFKPQPSDCVDDIQWAKKFLELTKPKVEEPEAEEQKIENIG